MGAILSKAAFDSAIFNININLPYLKDESLKSEMLEFINEKKGHFNKTIDYIIGL